MIEISIYSLFFIVLILAIYLSYKYKGKVTGRYSFYLAYSFIIIAFLESCMLFGFFLRDGQILFLIPHNYNSKLFQEHPHMVAKGVKNASLTKKELTIKHNNFGFRGNDFSIKKSNKKRIIAIGGSTTYGVGVSNKDTWPSILENKLGSQYEVYNMGIPAASTVEHIHLLSTIVPEFEPDYIILHIGLNDIRNMHVPNLEPDYSNFHAPSMIGNLGLCQENNIPRIGILRAIIVFLQEAKLYPSCLYNKIKFTSNKKKDEIDKYAKKLFIRNATTLINISKQIKAEVILVPQIVLEEIMLKENYSWWVPYLSPKFIDNAIKSYNESLEKIAKKIGVHYLKDVDLTVWSAGHFADVSHLNAEGNNILAKLISENLNKESL